jgi:hypothetical protein
MPSLTIPSTRAAVLTRRRGAAPLVLPQLVISDTFTRASSGALGSADTGQAWRAVRGTWDTTGTQAGCVTSVGGLAYADIELGSVGHSSQFDMSASNLCGVCCRGSADGSSYLVFYAADGKLYKVVGGTTSTALHNGVGAVAAPATIKLSVIGNVANCYVGGVLSFSYTLAGGDIAAFASNTRVGIYGDSSNSPRQDNFKAWRES